MLHPVERHLAAMLLLLTGLAGCETAPPAGAGIAPATADQAARLPSDAAGFLRGPSLPMGDGKGQEVAYAPPGRTAAGATVEVYRSGTAPVPDGTETDQARDAFQQLVQEALRPQPPRQVSERRRLTLPVAGPPLLRCAETEGSYGREKVEGLVCAGAAGGSLLRLHVVMPQRNPPAADATAFATAILAAMRGG